MRKPNPYGYYYGKEADQYTFYRLPKALFTNTRFKSLSDGAKILYGLMLDRMGLSVKNGWIDNQNRVYIIFTLEDVQNHMNCKHDKAIKIFTELDTIKGVGLIERVKQGQGKPAIIYVRKFFDTL
ncbi:MAG: replication initiator protein A [Defluviitaleaceae bacterium]|nr:replication initiator protein A [Defluviitaleaceae bacterium]